MKLEMLQLYFHTNYIYYSLNIYHGPADDGGNTIAGQFVPLLPRRPAPARSK